MSTLVRYTLKIYTIIFKKKLGGFSKASFTVIVANIMPTKSK